MYIYTCMFFFSQSERSSVCFYSLRCVSVILRYAAGTDRTFNSLLFYSLDALEAKQQSSGIICLLGPFSLDGMWKLRHSRDNPIIINCQCSPTDTSACCCRHRCCCWSVGFVSRQADGLMRLVELQEPHVEFMACCSWNEITSVVGVQWMSVILTSCVPSILRAFH